MLHFSRLPYNKILHILRCPNGRWGYYSEIIELGHARCEDWHHDKYQIIYQTTFGGIISGIRINETFITSHTSGGLLDKYGNCEDTTFTNVRAHGITL